MIKEFFPDKLSQFVDENHICKCNICGKDISNFAQISSTDQSSNPNNPLINEGNIIIFKTYLEGKEEETPQP